MGKFFRKAKTGIKSLWVYTTLKLKYQGRIQIAKTNRIRGKFNIDIAYGASVSIGEWLDCHDPFNLKCLDNCNIRIGKHCFFNHNASITCASSVTIGDKCMFGNNLVIVDHDHSRSKGVPTEELSAEPIRIGNNVWVGANVVILKGVNIGNNAVVAAGAVVNTDVPEGAVVGGVPAHILITKR